MNIDYKAIGERIRNHRRMNGLTQAQLADHVGCSVAFIGHIERGTRKMSIETLINIGDALHLTTDYILGR